MRTVLVVLSAATFFLALSGFDCASPEMTTAKLARKNKDYAKAETSLKKEISAHPQNGEAWMLLGETYREQGRLLDMIDAYTKAEAATTPPITPGDRTNIAIYRFNGWLTAYNAAIEKFSGTSKDYAGALALLDTASKIRPENFDNSYLRASVYQAMNNLSAETAEYERYITLVQPDVEKGMQAGLVLGMTRDQVESKIGKPASTDNLTDSTYGSAYYDARNLTISYRPGNKKGDPVVVDGWHFLGANSPELYRRLNWALRSAPYYTLGANAYTAGESNPSQYDVALKNLQIVEKLDPQQEGIGPIIADIYNRTGKSAEARAAFEANLRQNPNDPSLYINYGTFLLNQKEKDYAGAIEKFKKALEVSKKGDKQYQTALYDLGAAYKNWGADLQGAAGDKPTAKQKAEVDANLREALGYFEKMREAAPTDYHLLTEMGNLYGYFGNESKFKEINRQLEGLKTENKDNLEYWSALYRYYAVLGMEAEGKVAEAQVNRLSK